MSGIHDAITTRLQAVLQAACIDDITAWEQANGTTDPAKAGVVKIGFLQGAPEPDEARISITIHENDPDDVGDSQWADEIVEVEVGGAVTWARRFSIRTRCLLVNTKETLAEARTISSTLIDRVEAALLKEKFTGVASGNETVTRPVMATSMSVSTTQGGGPPDSFDFETKILFDVLTTRTGVYA